MPSVISDKGIRALTRLVRGTARQSTTGFSPSPLSIDRFPHPFAVRWASDVRDGDGGWCIWLPDNEVLRYDNQPLRIINTATDGAATPLPSGWWLIPDAIPTTGTTDLWLIIDYSTSATPVSFAAQTPTNPQAESKLAIKIATLSRDASTLVAKVKPWVVGSLDLSPASGSPIDFDASLDGLVTVRNLYIRDTSPMAIVAQTSVWSIRTENGVKKLFAANGSNITLPAVALSAIQI